MEEKIRKFTDLNAWKEGHKFCLFVARDLGYVDKRIFLEAENQCIIVNKLINGLIKKSRIIHNS